MAAQPTVAAFNPQSCYSQQAESGGAPASFNLTGEEFSNLECKVVEGPMAGQTLFDQMSTPDQNGGVLYCQKGSIFSAKQSPLIKELLEKSGATSNELGNVRFFYVPTSQYNAWAYKDAQNNEIIVLHRGLLESPPQKGMLPVDDDGALAAVLVHELGHIKDIRKTGFTNLLSARKRVSDTCNSRLKQVKNCGELKLRAQQCTLELAMSSRNGEHSADANIAQTFSRLNGKLALNPYSIVDTFRSWGDKYNIYDSHPEGKMRAFYVEKGLKEAGVPSALAGSKVYVQRLLKDY